MADICPFQPLPKVITNLWLVLVHLLHTFTLWVIYCPFSLTIHPAYQPLADIWAHLALIDGFIRSKLLIAMVIGLRRVYTTNEVRSIYEE